ncbi:MAG: PqqD family protein [Cyanosarcina radialis HA8281-LM2]|jgi:hypothetical protein|nr:PqqD family protein [Cyanosarcina radialis HA8281-LM2]
MIASPLSDETQIQIDPDITFGDVDGEIVALNVQSGSYLHLNSSGSYIFSLLDDSAPRPLAEIYKLVRQTYNVEDDVCRREVAEFVARCLALGLVRLAT